MRGLIIISLPKSGTMFLSGYLSTITEFNFKFGLFETDLKTLLYQIPFRPDPYIQKYMTRGSPSPRSMAKRYLQMLNRTRGLNVPCHKKSIYRSIQNPDTRWILADHGFDNFLVFLRNPCNVKVLKPERIIREAERLEMGVLYLYRNMGAVVHSMAHFLASGKSFLMTCQPLESALKIALNKYAPILAEHKRIWEKEFKKGLMIQYEELHYHTKKTINRICKFYSLNLREHRIISSMKQFKTWTYRKGDPDDWKTCLTPEQMAYLERRYSDMLY